MYSIELDGLPARENRMVKFAFCDGIVSPEVYSGSAGRMVGAGPWKLIADSRMRGSLRRVARAEAVAVLIVSCV